MVLPNLNPLKKDRVETTTDLSADGTANTYLVHAPGTYRFDARVMGNGDAGVPDGAGFTDYNGSEIASAALSGGVSARVLWQECVSQITDVKYDGSSIEFTTSDHVVPSNAVIALCDAAGRIVWSWQIWFTDELNADDVIVNANTNETVVAQGLNRFSLMDRNLGAMCRLDGDATRFPKKREGEITVIQYTDESKTIPTGKSFTTKVYQHGVASNSYYKPLCYCGMKYQWGRKDPFVSPYTSGNWAGLRPVRRRQQRDCPHRDGKRRFRKGVRHNHRFGHYVSRHVLQTQQHGALDGCPQLRPLGQCRRQQDRCGDECPAVRREDRLRSVSAGI